MKITWTPELTRALCLHVDPAGGQREVAYRTGLSQPAINRIVNGLRRPQPRTAAALTRLAKRVGFRPAA